MDSYTPVTFDLWNYFSDAEAPNGDFTGYVFAITGESNGTAVLNEVQLDYKLQISPAPPCRKATISHE